jgi:hypothetical protein
VTSDDIEVDGPFDDEETGARLYRATRENRVVEFSIFPVQSADGQSGWTLRVGTDESLPGDTGFEPYESADDAVEAGKRAAHALLAEE